MWTSARNLGDQLMSSPIDVVANEITQLIQ